MPRTIPFDKLTAEQATARANRTPVERAKRTMELASEGMNPLAAVAAEALERGCIKTSPKTLKNRWFLHRKILREQAPEFYRDLIKRLGGISGSAKRIAKNILDGQEAELYYQGNPTGMPDHVNRRGASGLALQMWRDAGKVGAAIESLDIAVERNELERQKVETLGQITKPQQIVVQILFQTLGGVETVDAKCSHITGPTPALPGVEQTVGVPGKPSEAHGTPGSAGFGEK